MLKKTLITLFFVLSLTQTIHAKANSDFKLYFFQDSKQDENLNGVSIYLFSYGNFEEVRTGDVYAFFCNLKIKNRINGTVYSFFSNITVDSFGFANQIISLSSKVTHNKDINIMINSLLNPLFNKTVFVNDYLIFSDIIPNFYIILFCILLKVLICLVFISMQRYFFTQTCAYINKHKKDSLNYGLIQYVLSIIIMFLGMLSLVGLPIFIVVFVVLYFSIICGQSSLGIAIGNLLTKKAKLKQNVFVDAVIGVFILETLSFVPLIGVVLKFAILPIVYCGLFECSIINMYIKKIFYSTPYDLELFKPNKSNKIIRDILLKNDE